MAKKRNEEVDSENATEKVDAIIDDFVVQQPSLARMRSTKDSLVISRKLKLLEAPDEYLVDEEYGVEEDIYEDNDGHEKEVKL